MTDLPPPTEDDVKLQYEYMQRAEIWPMGTLAGIPQPPGLVARFQVSDRGPGRFVLFHDRNAPLPLRHAIYARALQLARGEHRTEGEWDGRQQGSVYVTWIDIYLDDIKDTIVLGGPL